MVIEDVQADHYYTDRMLFIHVCSAAGPRVNPWSTAASDGDETGRHEKSFTAAGPT